MLVQQRDYAGALQQVPVFIAPESWAKTSFKEGNYKYFTINTLHTPLKKKKNPV